MLVVSNTSPISNLAIIDRLDRLRQRLYAKSAALIPSVQQEIIRLRQKAKFYIDPDIERFILKQCGE